MATDISSTLRENELGDIGIVERSNIAAISFSGVSSGVSSLISGT